MIIRVKNYIKTLLTWWYRRPTVHISVPIASERLRDFFRHANIKILDVGARGGPLDQFAVLAPFSHLFICESDAPEAKRVEEILKHGGNWENVTTIPAALFPSGKTAVLHLAKSPGLSSLLPANINEMKKFYTTRGWSTIEKDITIPALTLDEAAKQYGFLDLSVIKLDTQGTELDILTSGPKTLSSVLAVYVETEFVPLYQNQPLFSDVQKFLDSQRFRLIDIKRTTLRRKTAAKPIYSKREVAWVHGLYIREKNNDGSDLSPFQKVRLAVLAAAFEFFDYAIWLLENPEVRAYCEARGFGEIEKDIKEYAENFWRALKPHLNWFEKRMAIATNITDRKMER